MGPSLCWRRVKRLAALLVAVCIAGCGSSGNPRSATLVLDFTPNAVHAGIYLALSRGFDRAQGVRLHVLAPSASTDAVRLLATGRAQFGVLDIHDLAIARERGEDLVGIMALVERPLAAVIAAPRIRDPRQLQGATVGVTGVPSDTAVLRSIVAGSGGAPGRVRTVTIGFDAVAALLSGRVAAATAFWNDEGVTLARRRPGFHIFRADRFGAPAYPELVVCATHATLSSDPALARAVVRALVHGYRAALADPGAAERALQSRVAGLDPGLVAAELRAELPAFATRSGAVGVLQPGVLRAWARWELRFGIVRRAPDVAAAFDPGLA